MAALNFHERFADKVESGEKTQTIRAFRKIPIKVGEILYLYTGLRTKHARKLGEGKCTSNGVIEIRSDAIYIRRRSSKVWIGGKKLDQFARSDGFESWEDMKKWWLNVHGLPFTGNIIEWELIQL